jgi:8-amino-3,8-dideoxy-alpha-D-manno-octulosonate transaminase
MMIGEEEKRAVEEVLESQSLFRYYGPKLLKKTETFEREFAASVGQPYALAVSSGTAALRTTFVALGIKPGDEILMPAYSFLACPTAAITCGAIPIFVECDESLLLDPVDLQAKVNSKSKAILVVHTNGAAAAMEPILEMARSRSLLVIEDCAQAFGATYQGHPVGSFGHVATFSLQYLKVITCGEGGVFVTGDKAVYGRAVGYHDLGFERRGRKAEAIVGENLRMSELSGAVALAQLRKSPLFLERMRRHRRRLVDSVQPFEGIRVREGPDPAGDNGSSLILQFAGEEEANFFRKALRAENIPCDACSAKLSYGFRAMLQYRRPCRDGSNSTLGDAPYRLGLCPYTESILKRSVAISISPAFSDRDVEDIILGIRVVVAHLPSAKERSFSHVQ